MNWLVFLPLLFALIPVGDQEPDIQCPGRTTRELRICAYQKWKESHKALMDQLKPEILEKWQAASEEVCAAAYAPYRRGTIYPQVVTGCVDKLNRVLLCEHKGLGRKKTDCWEAEDDFSYRPPQPLLQ